MKKIDIHIHPKRTDPFLDKYVEIMDKYNVAAALVHGSISFGEGTNEEILKAVKKHPGKLYGSVYVDLRLPVKKSLELLKEYADNGFVSMKLFPNFGYEPGNPVYEPIWDELEKRKMICFPHCGWLGADEKTINTTTKVASPYHFEIAARRHPGINFIFAHFGGAATYIETIVLTSRLKNCFADTCPGWGTWVFENNMPGLQSLFKDQIMYGTDNAGEQYGKDQVWWPEKLKTLGYKEEDINKFFYLNAAKLLGIEKK